MEDLLCYKDKIKSIQYDNGLRKYMDYKVLEIGEVGEITFPPTVQTLTIDFGDCELEIVGRATWISKVKEENENPKD